MIKKFPHEINDFCMRDHCHYHHVDEPINENTYKICRECYHAFQTKFNLILAHNAIIWEMYKKNEWETWRQWLEKKFKRPMRYVISADKIFCCPFCTHDF